MLITLYIIHYAPNIAQYALHTLEIFYYNASFFAGPLLTNFLQKSCGKGLTARRIFSIGASKCVYLSAWWINRLLTLALTVTY